MTTIQEALAAPFTDGEVKVRPGATNRDKTQALALHYIDARAVMDRLDAVLGLEGWQDAYILIDFQHNGVECRLSCRLGEEWITKADVGYPNAENDVEPLKGAYSDALKRAAVRFGVGRFLYDMEREWREIDQYGRFTDSAVRVVDQGTGEIHGSLVDAARAAVGQPIPVHARCPDHGTERIRTGIAKGGPLKGQERYYCTTNMGTREQPNWCNWEQPLTAPSALQAAPPPTGVPLVSRAQWDDFCRDLRVADRTLADVARVLANQPNATTVQRWMQQGGYTAVGAGLAALLAAVKGLA